MRALMLSKALVVGAYQRKAECIAAEPGMELTVAVPPVWRGDGPALHLTRDHVEGYNLVETPIRFPSSFHLHHYPRFERLLDEVQPELLHIDEEAYNLATRQAVRAARKRGIRCLFFTWQNLQRRYPPPFGGWEREVFRLADGAIAGTATAAEVLRAKGYQGPLWTIPQFGVDPQIFHPPEGGRTMTAGELVVGYAGRLVPEKGVDLLVRAMRGLPGGVRLEIVGSGPERKRLIRQSETLRVAHRVNFRRALPSTEMPAFYRDVDCVVLPSRSTSSWTEQFGRVLVEGMASGAVAVGADSGEIGRVIGDAGRLFPEEDVAQLRGMLAHLANDVRLRESLAKAGLARVHEHFSMQRVAQETVAAWQALLDG
jgi:glycosyltransferase involved in cell wall biosynthesis